MTTAASGGREFSGWALGNLANAFLALVSR
jgi:hypothetical protein